MKNINIYIILLSIVFISINAQAVNEYKLKSALIEQFTKFIEWPDSWNSAKSEKPFVICIFGKSEISHYIKNDYSETKIKGKNVKIIETTFLQDILQADILYIGKVDEYRLRSILELINKKPILTLSDSEGFADKGVMVNFITFKNKVKFEVNTTSINNANIKMSSLLLNYAIIK